jgi:hypothetical protein
MQAMLLSGQTMTRLRRFFGFPIDLVGELDQKYLIILLFMICENVYLYKL